MTEHLQVLFVGTEKKNMDELLEELKEQFKDNIIEMEFQKR